MKIVPEYDYYYDKLLTILSSDTSIKVSPNKPKIKNRKVPNEPAKCFEENTIKDGMDGNKYIVKITPTVINVGINIVKIKIDIKLNLFLYY